MAAQTWTLFDQSTNEHIGYKVFGRSPSANFIRHRGGLAEGVEMVELDNSQLRVQVLPTRGMSLWKAAYHGPKGLEPIEWQSPTRGPVHPQFVDVAEPSGLGWLDGFDELLVRCGLESNGAPEHDKQGRLMYPLHGRIANKPAYRVDLTIDEDEGDVTLTGWVEETRFHFLKVRMKSTLRLKAGAPSLEIEDEITNISASPAEIQMLYHVNFGQPLLDGGSQVLAPVEELVPRNDHAATGIDSWNHYAAETPGYEEQVYFAKLFSDANAATKALLKNAHGTRGIVLRFKTTELPCFTLWKNTTAGEDGYVTGIEPGTNFPNPRTFEGEHGRVIKLDGKGKASLQIGLDYCPNQAEVDAAEASVRALQKSAPKIHREPHPDWCAPG